ncbi:MAG TPA: hypothetical protein VN944_07330 [Nitrospiria bacterium]|nr:hypothetical protein [Nitrospiria bacterium]
MKANIYFLWRVPNDPDVIQDFITKVTPTYGPFVTGEILDAISEVNGNKTTGATNN